MTIKKLADTWENGKCAIPNSVVEQLLAMRQQRKKHLHAIIEKINNRIGNNTMRFFPDLTAFNVSTLMAILLTEDVLE